MDPAKYFTCPLGLGTVLSFYPLSPHIFLDLFLFPYSSSIGIRVWTDLHALTRRISAVAKRMQKMTQRV